MTDAGRFPDLAHTGEARETAMNPEETRNPRDALDHHASESSAANARAAGAILRFDSIELDPTTQSASRAGRPLTLRPRQFDLLAFLVRNPDRVVSQEEIADAVWGEPTATWTNVIAVSIHELRKELEQTGHPTMLHTVRGQGYFLGADPSEGDGPVSPQT